MARNAEKAMTTLARWRAAQVTEQGGAVKEKERRPFLASECTDLPKAEKWRMQIIREIARKVAQIQNAGLGEFRIRDLNDEINKLLREKGHWEAQIRELGGPDYARVGPRMLDHEGKEVPGNRGYKYFGAAKELPGTCFKCLCAFIVSPFPISEMGPEIGKWLTMNAHKHLKHVPGVRELFEQEPPPPPRKTRGELMKDIDADYYGYRDDDDGVLIPIEAREERKAIARAVTEWKAKKEAILNNEIADEQMEEDEEENIYAVAPDVDMSDDDSNMEGNNEGDSSQPRFIAHVPVPSQKEVEQALLQRKKQELLDRYASETVMAQAEEAKVLLGVLSSSST